MVYLATGNQTMHTDEKNINVSISNVIMWFQESENCILHNHAQQIPITEIKDNDIIQSIIDNFYC